MANLSVTNREQSIILAKAGLDLDTADYTIIVKLKYHLWMDKNYVMYSSDDGRQIFLTTGINLIYSVVEMIRQLLADDFELDYEKV